MRQPIKTLHYCEVQRRTAAYVQGPKSLGGTRQATQRLFAAGTMIVPNCNPQPPPVTTSSRSEPTIDSCHHLPPPLALCCNACISGGEQSSTLTVGGCLNMSTDNACPAFVSFLGGGGESLLLAIAWFKKCATLS